MTHMPGSISPYPTDPFAEQRTSILAIASLILAILCVTAPIGVVLAVIALLVIANSNGRLAGRGLAIAGLIIGLIASAFWIAAVVGAVQVGKQLNSAFTGPLGAMMTSIEQGDSKTARTYLTNAGAARVTDADFQRFVSEYQAELGAFQSTPQGWSELFGSYAQIGPQIEKYQKQQGGSSQNTIPVAGKFEKSLALLMFQVDNSGAAPGSAAKIPIVNVLVVLPSGKHAVLYQAPATPPPFPDPPASPGMPKDTDTPTPTEPDSTESPASGGGA
jgi:hypothetical protein